MKEEIELALLFRKAEALVLSSFGYKKTCGAFLHRVPS
jgi:hypothetical protein